MLVCRLGVSSKKKLCYLVCNQILFYLFIVSHAGYITVVVNNLNSGITFELTKMHSLFSMSLGYGEEYGALD
eukprot:snap_masked-scaffold_7-processed-gene-4.26-mRNA-1 protein AED:0.47 eAED:1.00 QI:0/0/0/1/1/1/2/0/71